MIASLEHAVDRTKAYYDQLGMLWSPEANVSLTVHGLKHEQLHQLGGDAVVFSDGLPGHAQVCIVSTRVRTPAGWEVGFFGDADLGCETCRRLARQSGEHLEALALAGIVEPERMP